MTFCPEHISSILIPKQILVILNTSPHGNITSRPLLILDLGRDAYFWLGASAAIENLMISSWPVLSLQRPGLDSFLDSIRRVYDVAIWSSASEDYVTGSPKIFCRRLVMEIRLVAFAMRAASESETYETDFIKDLKKCAAGI